MRLKLLAASLALGTALTPVEAHAAVISATLALIGGALAAGGIVTPLIGFGTIGAVNAGFAVGAFLTSGLGSLLVSVGLAAAQYLLAPRPQAPSIESARINVRIGEPIRWIHAGRSPSGGAAMFGEFAQDGAFWYVVVHGDSPIRSVVNYVFDEIPVTLDESNQVINAEFTRGQVEGENPVFRIWTTTFTPADPVPPAIPEFKAAFPEWTDDHLLVGTTYSVIRVDGLSAEDRYKVMRWRGPFGLGEPGVSIIGDWDYIYDPRDPGQDIDDRSTWGTSRNPALIWAWFRTHPWGRNKPLSSINWELVAANADICDETVTDKYDNAAPRYVCGISVPDSKERHVAESEILLSADAMIMHDETGRAYPHVGRYEAPTLTLSRRRDILAMASREAADGEMETDGVIVKYIEPDYLYHVQPAAAWINPNYYQEGTPPRYLTVEILACQNHNQAVRLAKAIGLRSQAVHRLVPTVGLRALLARRQRIVDLQYDDTFSGDYEIATPVEIDEAGVTGQFGVVPVDGDRWTLLAGEEGDKPAPIASISHDGELPDAQNVDVYAAPVPGSGGAVVRLEATFDAPTRVDYRFEFQYRRQGDTIWRPMLVRMDDLLAYSDTVDDGEVHEVQSRTVTLGGRASDWTEPPHEVTAIADTQEPAALSGFTITPGVHLGGVEMTFVTASDDHLRRVSVYRVPAGGVLDKDAHHLVTLAAAPGTTFKWVHGDTTRTELLGNPDCATDTVNSKGTGWTHDAGDGEYDKAAGTASNLSQSVAALSGSTAVFRYMIDMTALSAGTFGARLIGGTAVDAPTFSSGGRHFGELAANGGNTHFALRAWLATSAGSVTYMSLIAKTPACATAGEWDFHAFPENGSGLEGPGATPVTDIIIV